MKAINFAEGLELPVDAATQTFAFLARKRAGKSYAASKLAEGFHESGVQFVVLDPVGNWYGLRVAADGKGKGLDVVLLGGLRGDITLDPSAGALVADTVLDSGRSFVLDVSQFSLGERKRFVQAFGERLWHRQKALADPQPIHVFLEEAQLFIPQQPQPEERPMLGIWCEIVRLGGNKGIGVTIISQRPQSVSKEALTQVECLVVLQVSGVPEKKALKEWIVENDASLDLLNELPFLKQGVAYVWSPQWLTHFGKHQVLPKKTYDASATPKVGVKRVQAEVKPINLEELRSKMSESVKKLEENDPKALKKRVAELERELSKKAPPPAKGETKTVERQVIKEGQLRRVEVLVERFTNLEAALRTDLKPLIDGLAAVKTPAPAPRPVAPARIIPPRPVTPPRAAPKEASSSDGLGRGERAMLEALSSRYPTPLTRNQLGMLAGYSASGGTFQKYLSTLKSLGAVETSGENVSLAEGWLLPAGEVAPVTDIVDMWRAKLGGGERKMFDALVEAWPAALERGELGERSGYESSGGTFQKYLSTLKSIGVAVTRGVTVVASDDLFPPRAA